MVAVLYISIPLEGLGIVVASVLLANATLGNSTPLFVEVTSSFADASGFAVPIPTLLFAASTEKVVPSTEKPFFAVDVNAIVLAPCVTATLPGKLPLPLYIPPVPAAKSRLVIVLSAILAEDTAPSAIFTEVMLASVIFAVVTALFAISTVAIDPSRIFAEFTAPSIILPVVTAASAILTVVTPASAKEITPFVIRIGAVPIRGIVVEVQLGVDGVPSLISC